MSKPDERPPFAPSALRAARSYRCWTVAELAARAAVSPSFVTKAELGIEQPGRSALHALASALTFPPEYFQHEVAFPDRSVLHFRKLSRVTERAIGCAMASLAFFCRIVDGFHEYARFAPAKLPVRTVSSPEDIEAASESLRSALGFKPGAPILDATRAMEAAGVCVGTFGVDIPVDGVCWWAQSPVVLLKQVCWSRARFNLLHEVAHLCFHRDLATSKEREAEAHRFAGAFLVPRGAFWREFPRPRTNFDWPALLAMKARWGVSVQALIHRAYDLEIINAAEFRRANIHIGHLGWKTSEPGEQEPESATTCQRFFDALEQRKAIGLQAFSRPVRLDASVVAELAGIRERPAPANVVVFPRES